MQLIFLYAFFCISVLFTNFTFGALIPKTELSIGGSPPIVDSYNVSDSVFDSDTRPGVSALEGVPRQFTLDVHLHGNPLKDFVVYLSISANLYALAKLPFLQRWDGAYIGPIAPLAQGGRALFITASSIGPAAANLPPFLTAHLIWALRQMTERYSSGTAYTPADIRMLWSGQAFAEMYIRPPPLGSEINPNTAARSSISTFQRSLPPAGFSAVFELAIPGDQTFKLQGTVDFSKPLSRIPLLSSFTLLLADLAPLDWPSPHLDASLLIWRGVSLQTSRLGYESTPPVTTSTWVKALSELQAHVLAESQWFELECEVVLLIGRRSKKAGKITAKRA